jgi:mercuric reductase
MCALDALAPATMAKCNSHVVSECAVTRQVIIVELDNQKILNAEDTHNIFVGINWQAARSATSCATSLCTEMIFLKGEEVAHRWQAGDTENREFFTLPEAVQFSAAFFLPLVSTS